jgi:hypothetical protein
MNHSLSATEMQLVLDESIITAKNNIIKTVVDLFGSVSELYKKQLYELNLQEQMGYNPKISKGEKYIDLPYVILDYPGLFSKEGVFAIRSFFWWGNFFSITLHISGKYLDQYEQKILEAINAGALDDWFINNNGNQWQHHFELDNYTPVSRNQNKFQDYNFIKLAKKIPLHKWDETEKFFIANFSTLIKLVTS